jgi:hypothetical protein
MEFLFMVGYAAASPAAAHAAAPRAGLAIAARPAGSTRTPDVARLGPE